jgi:hypothetical protein
LHPERAASAATLHSKTALNVFALTLNKDGSNVLAERMTNRKLDEVQVETG